ncbi:MAG: sigma-54-dependent Fis family transcriptional regulator [Planctomycetes bacterium]|nr:sigma-54-dependent Fis family transcriptional regulator [Planctomycetota bacterium]
MARRVLVVDDELNMLSLFRRILTEEGYEMESAATGHDALRMLEDSGFDLVISDLEVPGVDGMKLLKHVRQACPDVPFIVVTGYGTVESAVAAMKDGAHDYITKPFEREELKIVIRKAMERRELFVEVTRLRSEQDAQFSFESIIGKSKKMQDIFSMTRRIADSASTVLIQGESGTGKELFAKAIHRSSPRKNKPFLAVNASGLPESLLESELFGHVKGAFTGAIRSKKGLFEEADGGTLFLDEIGDVALALQAKLLRVLQEREVKPVGSNEVRKVDVRVIAATNRELTEAVREKGFREDLYYRLAVITLHIPPLRDRTEDLSLLVEHFIKKYATLNHKDIQSVSREVMERLLKHGWKGNVRELENVIERAVIISDNKEVGIESLPPEFQPEIGRLTVPEFGSGPLAEVVERATRLVERQAIVKALSDVRGNKSEACRRLQISRGTLYNKIRTHGL